MSSGLTLIWRLQADVNEARRERVEKVALRIVGILFVALALYVSYDSIKSLITREPPEHSIPGIILAVASFDYHASYSRVLKRRVATAINSGALSADARQTELCTYLSCILLGGLLLNALWGWWWADPIAALVMVPIIAKEGVETLRGETCADMARVIDFVYRDRLYDLLKLFPAP